MKDLAAVDNDEQKAFFDSFDQILCDVDGVLWHFHKDIPGASAAIKSLKTLGKKVTFVSNNCTKSHDTYCQQLRDAGYDIDQSDLILPILAMISYLKKIDFSKELYVIGMTPLRTALEEAGFKLAEYGPHTELESVGQFAALSIADNDKVGAVIADLDINMTVIKLQKAATYLKRSDVIFITGGSDKKLCFGPDAVTIGPGCFHQILEAMTERKPVLLAKPGPEYNEFLKEKRQIGDPSRVLFIGDSVAEDMGFAANCGYKKLLVLSGLTQREELTEWRFPEEYKPEYYVDSLQVIQDILTSVTRK